MKHLIENKEQGEQMNCRVLSCQDDDGVVPGDYDFFAIGEDTNMTVLVLCRQCQDRIYNAAYKDILRDWQERISKETAGVIFKRLKQTEV